MNTDSPTKTQIRQFENELGITMGSIMYNKNGKNSAFMLFGSMYTTNFKRVKIYSMDDHGWVKTESTGIPFISKCWQVLTGKVKKLK